MEIKIADLTLQNEEKDVKILSLQHRIAEMEQYSRNKNTEIHGVLEQDKEDVEEIVVAVGEILGVSITKDVIEASHRAPTKAEGITKPIVDQLRSRKVRDQIVANRETRVTNKNVLHRIEVNNKQGDNNVYVYEQLLSMYYKDLLWKAKAKAQENDWNYVWSSGGKIWAKKNERGKAIRLFTEFLK